MATLAMQTAEYSHVRPKDIPTNLEEHEAILKEIANKTETSLMLLQGAKDIGIRTNRELAVQGEQIEGITGQLRNININLGYSENILEKLSSPFGFTGRAKKYKHVFESKYGAPAEWSGPMVRERSIMKSREMFFALLRHRLFCYQDSAHISRELLVISLTGATLRSHHEKMRFYITVVEPKTNTYRFKCQSRTDFFGWISVLAPRCMEHFENVEKGESFHESFKAFQSSFIGDTPNARLDKEVQSSENETSSQTTDPELQFERNLHLMENAILDLQDVANTMNREINEQGNKILNLETATIENRARLSQVTNKGKKIS